MKYAMSVTVFSPQIIDHNTCEQFWWRNVLYVNSLYPRTEMVMYRRKSACIFPCRGIAPTTTFICTVRLYRETRCEIAVRGEMRLVASDL